ncbi:MAG: SGNH/GDSL hydrolase family protein [Flavobacteriaceae bacterium]
MPTITYRSILLLLLGLNIWVADAQDPSSFEKEVEDLSIKYDSLWDKTRETIVFTGSSSIRLWSTLQDVFPRQQIINTGFGGSQTSDLLEFIDKLVLQYKPSKVFIYEGDNDLNDNKSPREVTRLTTKVVERIKNAGTASSVVLISTKPSIQRWHLKRKYKKLNRKLARLCQKDPFLDFANIWDPMLTNKKLRKDLFIEDGLHMNEAGYEIWFQVIKKYIKHSP